MKKNEDKISIKKIETEIKYLMEEV